MRRINNRLRLSRVFVDYVTCRSSFLSFLLRQRDDVISRVIRSLYSLLIILMMTFVSFVSLVGLPRKPDFDLLKGDGFCHFVIGSLGVDFLCISTSFLNDLSFFLLQIKPRTDRKPSARRNSGHAVNAGVSSSCPSCQLLAIFSV